MKPYYIKNLLEVGLDEAGRGPLFGRVYVGAAILPQDKNFTHEIIKDSKKLSLRKRLIAFDYIKENAIDYSVAWVDKDTIDEINIFQATLRCMHIALDKLIVRPDHILVDGHSFRNYYREKCTIPHTCVEGGDNKYTSIAAGSILAKVSRDKYIEELCAQYENLDKYYHLLKNKGYGTAEHIQGIKSHGISPWHRRTFGICKTFD